MEDWTLKFPKSGAETGVRPVCPQVSRFSRFPVSGIASEARALNQAHYAGVALVGVGTGMLSNDYRGGATAAVSFGVAVAGGLLPAAKAIPVVGNILSFGALAYDAVSTYRAQTMHGGEIGRAEVKRLSDDDPQKSQELADYIGLKIGAILAPVVLLFGYLGNADAGLAVFIVLGVMAVAIRTRWNLRKHVWFWAILIFIFALHVPLFFVVRWPHGTVPTVFYTIPVGITDFLVISGALNLAERLLSKLPPSRGKPGDKK